MPERNEINNINFNRAYTTTAFYVFNSCYAFPPKYEILLLDCYTSAIHDLWNQLITMGMIIIMQEYTSFIYTPLAFSFLCRSLSFPSFPIPLYFFSFSFLINNVLTFFFRGYY